MPVVVLEGVTVAIEILSQSRELELDFNVKSIKEGMHIFRRNSLATRVCTSLAFFSKWSFELSADFNRVSIRVFDPTYHSKIHAVLD